MAVRAAIGISTAQARNTVAFIADGATGPTGSDALFEAGKTGGVGLFAIDAGVTYAFAANPVSTIPGTPAFYLRYVDGSVGNGAIPPLGNVVLNGTANVTTTTAPGIAVDLQGRQGGRGGNSGGIGRGGNAGAGGWAGGPLALLHEKRNL